MQVTVSYPYDDSYRFPDQRDASGTSEGQPHGKDWSDRKAKQGGQGIVPLILFAVVFDRRTRFGIDGAQLTRSGRWRSAQMPPHKPESSPSSTKYSRSARRPIPHGNHNQPVGPTTRPKNGHTAGTRTSSASAAPGADLHQGPHPNPGVAVRPGRGRGTNSRSTTTRAVPMTSMKMIGVYEPNVTVRATARDSLDVMVLVPMIVTHPWRRTSSTVAVPATERSEAGDGRQAPPRSQFAGDRAKYPSKLHRSGCCRLERESESGPNDRAGPDATGADSAVLVPIPSSGSTRSSPDGTTEHYLQPGVSIRDPLASVTRPARPGTECCLPG